MTATTTATKQPTTNRYPTMPERIESLLTTRRVLAQQDGAYLVESSTDGQFYRVTRESCTCADHIQRSRACKHMLAVQNLLANLAPAIADRRAVAIYTRSEGRARLGLTAPVGADRAFAELFG